MSNFHVEPPSTNRGVLSTSQTGLRACVDWVQVTFKNVTDFTQIISLLGMEIGHFLDMQTGKYGYKCQKRCGNIAIYYDGREDMGVHLEMTGQACREYENMKLFDWPRLFALFTLFECYFTRLDLAIDDFEGYFKITTIKNKVRKAEIRSLFRTAKDMRKTSLKDGSSLGDTVYFGSEKSDIQIRMYDKYLQMLSKGQKLEDGIEFWNRTELQLRDKRAQAAAFIIMFENAPLGEIISGLLKRYVNFLNPSGDSNRSRWDVCKWWDRFLGDVKPLQLSLIAPDRTVERTQDWIDRQVESNLSMLNIAYDDITFIFDSLINGLDKLKNSHINTINNYLTKTGKKAMTKEEFLQILKKKKIDIQTIKNNLNA